MSEETSSLAALTDEGLEALLKRAIRITLIVGLLAALALWKGSGWRNAGMMATGTVISAASIYEWRRLIRLINFRLDGAKLGRKETPKGALMAGAFFVFRLVVFAGVIYGSLKCFRGSVVALLVGLGLAVVALVWEALRLLRG